MPLATPDKPRFATSRRNALKLGALGLASGAAPALAVQAPGFTHNVASGEPGADRVLLWTRFVAPGEGHKLTWQVSPSADFARIVASGSTIAAAERDWCAKAWAEGLQPGTWYYYRFVSPFGDISPVGRTKSLPKGKVARFRMAVFSCSNFGFGWFNAYAHACEADEFDLAVHLGDYFYEYKWGEYPEPGEAIDTRMLHPEGEAMTLTGYRERLATYRADPDLQRLHALYPVLAMWDDHEVANDTWKGGAENHQPDEGDFPTRLRMAEQAWREWLPVSDNYWESYEIGNLASLYRLETRHVARDQPFDLGQVIKAAPAGKVGEALVDFRDGPWRDPSRTLLGAEQEAWLARGLKQSTRAGKRWQVLAQEVIMGSLVLPDVVTVPREGADPRVKRALAARALASKAGLPLNMDAWDGYPAARERLYRAAIAARANLVVLSGDSHNAWAFDLDLDGKRVGVELAGHSVTSPGAETTVGWIKPQALADETVKRNAQLKWCDTAQRGYMAVELTPKAVTGEFRFLASVRQRGAGLAGTHRMTVRAGKRKFSA
jgi:alkaline phosphatase D